MKKLLLLLILAPLSTTGQDAPDSLQAENSWGSITVRARNFFMATINQGELSDYYANGIGAGIAYQTPVWKNFHGMASGFYSVNVASSDFSQADATSGQFNRYEIGLFDVADAANKYELGRLEELYLEYGKAGTFIRFGKMKLNTPFINPQDGRMSPSFEEGIWSQLKAARNFTLRAGWLYKMAPRSTVKWYRVENTLGLYPSGVDVTGTKSNYFGNVASGGVFILGAEYRQKQWMFQGWNTLIENINNTLLLQLEVSPRIENGKLLTGIQLIRQDAVNDGGNADQQKTYMAKGSFTNAVSLMGGVKVKEVEVKLNYTHISDDGRFLFPREWGRDPFYTFLPRERNEGYGGVNAVMLLAIFTPVKNFTGSFGYGHYYLPDPMNFELNKYGFPSYSQANLDIRYQFSGALTNFSGQLLIVYKKNLGDTHENPRFVINKVDMMNFNFVLNYVFTKK